MKQRLDHYLLERGLASTRSKAQELIKSGKVLVNEQVIVKAGHWVVPEDVIRLLALEHPYVSRGALKLKGALDFFSLDPKNQNCIDIGISTGGFTEVLLERGAKHVWGIDVGTQQLHERLRGNKRLTLWENTHILSLSQDQTNALPKDLAMAVVDLSFISLKKVMPHLLQLFPLGLKCLLLVKPQFEVGPEGLNDRGLVKNSQIALDALRGIENMAIGLGFVSHGSVESSLRGGEGNQEFFLCLEIVSP